MSQRNSTKKNQSENYQGEQMAVQPVKSVQNPASTRPQSARIGPQQTLVQQRQQQLSQDPYVHPQQQQQAYYQIPPQQMPEPYYENMHPQVRFENYGEEDQFEDHATRMQHVNFTPCTYDELNPRNYRHLPPQYTQYIKPAGKKTPVSYRTADCLYMFE